MKVLIVSSVGGHITEIMGLAPALVEHEVVLVVNDECALPDFAFARVYKIAHAERDLRVLWNFVECARILQVELPDVILSAGAGPAVPMLLLGRLAGARTIYIETAAAVERPTLTGRLLYHVVHGFFFQWPSLARSFRRGHLARIAFG